MFRLKRHVWVCIADAALSIHWRSFQQCSFPSHCLFSFAVTVIIFESASGWCFYLVYTSETPGASECVMMGEQTKATKKNFDWKQLTNAQSAADVCMLVHSIITVSGFIVCANVVFFAIRMHLWLRMPTQSSHVACMCLFAYLYLKLIC